VAHIPGTEQLADMGTKTLPAATLEKLRKLAGMEKLRGEPQRKLKKTRRW
jgi:hypothetical protein